MILVADRQRRVAIPRPRLKALARRVLEGEALWPCRLSLVFVDGREMRRLNRRWLHHDFDTDVLSFPLGGDPLLGEIVISADFATREAARRRIAVVEELGRYVVHGVLHLAGYDDRAPADRRRMWAVQERYVESLRPRSGPL